MTSKVFKKDKKKVSENGAIKKFRTIRSKLVSVITIICIILLTTTAVMLRNNISNEFDSVNEDYLTERSIRVSGETQDFFDKYTYLVEVLANNPIIQRYFVENKEGSDIEKSQNYEYVLDLIRGTQKGYTGVISSIFLAEESPSHILTSSEQFVSAYMDLSTKAYYDTLKDGKTHVSEPYVDTNTGDMAITISVPVVVNGVIEGEVCADIQLKDLEQITADSKFGETGRFTLLTEENIIAYSRDADKKLKNISEVNYDNILVDAVTNDSKEIVHFSSDGEKTVGLVSHIGDTGWKLISAMSYEEFSAGVERINNTIIKYFIWVQISIVVVLFLMVSKMIKPIRNVQVIAEKMAQGELDVDANITSNDEIGRLAQSISSLADRLKKYIAYINESSEVLGAFAQGDYRINLKQDYTGEFKKLKDAIVNVSEMQKEVLGEIKESTEIINSGSDQIASGAQATSQGATEQASAIEELSAEINVLAESIKGTAEEASNAGNKSVEAAIEVESGNKKMQELLVAINEISKSSEQIKKVIKVIDDIAFQTNILALNAAVEAARAGAAGKGFAVVADEVRNLAGKSAEAAKETTALIENSLLAINKGTTLADETGKTLERVVLAAEDSNQLIQEIVQGAQNGAASIEQIKIGVEQVSSVVQGNAATAEESAANSQELAAQVERLNQMINKFKL